MHQAGIARFVVNGMVQMLCFSYFHHLISVLFYTHVIVDFGSHVEVLYIQYRGLLTLIIFISVFLLGWKYTKGT